MEAKTKLSICNECKHKKVCGWTKRRNVVVRYCAGTDSSEPQKPGVWQEI
jgi:hypothetical protein